MDDPGRLRREMVDSLAHDSKGVLADDAVEAAMRAVPRHEFVEADHRAYLDQSHEARGTTVLAPSTVAWLLDALAPRPDEEVLVVGAGCGYTAAVLAAAVGGRHVHAIDIDRRLVLDAREALERAGYPEVLVDRRDAAAGLPEYAPFDAVLVEAAAVRPPAALLEQLAPDGRLVMPLGTADQQLAVVGAEGRERTAREERERAARAAESRAGWEQDWIDWD